MAEISLIQKMFDPTTLLASVTILITFLIFLLIIIEREMKKKKLSVKLDKNLLLDEEVSQIKRLKESKKMLESLDIIARDFLKDKYQIPKNIDYEQMAVYFKKKNMPKLSSFCENMLVALYSGVKLNEGNIELLINQLREVIRSELDEEQIKYGVSLNKENKQIIPQLSLLKETYESWSKNNKKVQPKKEIPPEIQEVYILKKSDKTQTTNQSNEQKNTPPKVFNSPQNEPPKHKFIQSLDNLERIETRLNQLKKDVITKRFN